jgi:hypothetical protein
MKFYLNQLHGPAVTVHDPEYRPSASDRWALPSKPSWDKPMGKKLCIIDVDNRPFDKPGEIFGPRPMSWDERDLVQGLSVAFLNHWVYGKASSCLLPKTVRQTVASFPNLQKLTRLLA